MIVILDLGSHENTVLARAIRALGVYSEIYPHDITAAELKALPNVKGIIINGGPNNVIDGVEIDVLPEIYQAGFPVIAAGHDKALCEVKLAQFADDIEAIKDAVKGFVADKDYLNKFIVSLATQWAADEAIVISTADAEGLKKYFAANAKAVLDKGVKIEQVNGNKTLFSISPADGSYKVNFGEEEFENYFKEFLRPQLVEMLF